MRILLVNHQFIMSGAAVMLSQIADILLADGHDISVATLDSTEGPMAQPYRDRGIPLLRDFKLRGYDLVIANTLLAARIVVQTEPAIPTIWWIRETEYGLKLLEKNPEWRKAFDMASRIVFPGATMRDNVFQSFLYKRRPDEVLIVPNGLDLPKPPPKVERNKRKYRIVNVGTMDRRKRQLDLIRAVDILDRDDIELVLIRLDGDLQNDAKKVALADPKRYHMLDQRSREETYGWIASAFVCREPCGVSG